MSCNDAWHIASQIAAALEYAHERGIVHRDLKPANIKITADGTVKLLDFGLAKAFNEPVTGSPVDPSNSPTLTMATQVGVILGTAAYMAPEQAKGKNVDKRADIWSFGVVLYELLTGQQLFQGEDVTETLAQVLTKQPNWEKVPGRVRRLLKACLERDPKRRLRDVGDALRMVEDDKPIAKKDLPFKIVAVALAVLLIPAVLISFVHFRELPFETPVLRATILPPENTTFSFDYTNGLGLFALSPDGRKIVVSARGADGKSQLWLRALDGLKAQPLAGTIGATFPFWSPDSRYIAFFADGQLKKMDVSGAPPVSLAEAPVGRGGSWGKANVIVFAPSNNEPLNKVSADGGNTMPVTKFVAEDGPQRLPWFLPDGKHFLYRVQGAPKTTIRIGSIDSAETKIVGPANSNAVYSRGNLFFRRDATLMAQPFDDKTLSTTGEAVAIAENVPATLSAGLFSVSDSGILVYQAISTPVDVDIADQALAWVDTDGKELERLRNPGEIGDIQFSPDRTKFAYTLWGSTADNKDIWIYDIARQLPSKFTFDPTAERYPVWSPDGKSIIFSSNKKQSGDIYRKATDLTGVEQLVWGSNGNKAPTSWSPDGKFVLVNTYSPSGKAGVHIWKLPVMPERPGGSLAQPSPFLDTGSYQEIDGQFSPEGKWVAYSSTESQRSEIYVTSFPKPGGKLQISLDGGTLPRWSPSGKEIFYVDPNSKLMAAEIIHKNESLEVGRVRQVLGGMYFQRGYKYDVALDGKRLLAHVIQGALQPTREPRILSEPLTLISNWPALLKK
jgi:Tol biopolymer transport system component